MLVTKQYASRWQPRCEAVIDKGSGAGSAELIVDANVPQQQVSRPEFSGSYYLAYPAGEAGMGSLVKYAKIWASAPCVCALSCNPATGTEPGNEDMTVDFGVTAVKVVPCPAVARWAKRRPWR